MHPVSNGEKMSLLTLLRRYQSSNFASFVFVTKLNQHRIMPFEIISFSKRAIYIFTAYLIFCIIYLSNMLYKIDRNFCQEKFGFTDGSNKEWWEHPQYILKYMVACSRKSHLKNSNLLEYHSSIMWVAVYVMSSIKRCWNAGKISRLKGEVLSAGVCQNWC